MRIEDLRSDPVGSSSSKPVAPARKAAIAPQAAGSDAGSRSDTVEISQEARELAAQADAGAVAGALSPERLVELRRWLAAGGHNDPKVLKQVAERLLESGELGENRGSEVSEP